MSRLKTAVLLAAIRSYCGPMMEYHPKPYPTAGMTDRQIRAKKRKSKMRATANGKKKR